MGWKDSACSAVSCCTVSTRSVVTGCSALSRLTSVATLRYWKKLHLKPLLGLRCKRRPTDGENSVSAISILAFWLCIQSTANRTCWQAVHSKQSPALFPSPRLGIAMKNLLGNNQRHTKVRADRQSFHAATERGGTRSHSHAKIACTFPLRLLSSRRHNSETQ